MGKRKSVKKAAAGRVPRKEPYGSQRLEVVVERVGVALQRGRLRGALGRDGLNEVADFF